MARFAQDASTRAATGAPRSDQAEGLRQLFAHERVRFVPVASNPHIACGGVMLERLCTAFAEHGVSTLVIDAAERAGDAGAMAMVDLAQCVERLSSDVSYMSARGLPIRFVDAFGSTRGFLQRAAESAPRCNVVLVHAGASELARLFAPTRDTALHGDGDATCPIVLADDHPASVTHAYASMKLLAQRVGVVVFDLLLGAAARSPRADRIADRIAACADDFLGTAMREWARIDPLGDPTDAPDDALRRLVGLRFAQPGIGRPLHPSAALAHASYATP